MTKMSEETRLARNAYFRQWRKENPEKALAIQEKYWKKKMGLKAESEEITIPESHYKKMFSKEDIDIIAINAIVCFMNNYISSDELKKKTDSVFLNDSNDSLGRYAFINMCMFSIMQDIIAQYEKETEKTE